MSGLGRTFFAVVASGLRLLAWVPFGIAEWINAGADWCERRAQPRPQGTTRP